MKIILSILIGAILFIGWHFFMDLTWKPEGSFDIISGAIIEFFMFTLILNSYNQQQQKQMKKELDAHLDNIERLLTEQKGGSGK